MTWTYEQNTGRLIDPNGVFMAKGYAGGNCGLNPEGVNNHVMQSVHNVGPLPIGKYTLGTTIEESHLGPCAIPLIPHPENQMFGRGNFYMHGDMIGHPGAGSEGCIIMARQVRMAVSDSTDKELAVIVAGA